MSLIELFNQSPKIDLLDDWDRLNSFWYHPLAEKLILVTTGTHTWDAIRKLGIRPLEYQNCHGNVVEDYGILRETIKQGWVRGRYHNAELYLQGQIRDVWKTSRNVADQVYVESLIIDFYTPGVDHNESITLHGRELERYIKCGWMPAVRRGN